jgi:hypothetical protein
LNQLAAHRKHKVFVRKIDVLAGVSDGLDGSWPLVSRDVPVKMVEDGLFVRAGQQNLKLAVAGVRC